jgi:hypothetical protein
MSIHSQILAELNLQVGDTVKITHKVPDHNLGWTNSWTYSMDVAVGKTGVITNINGDNGVSVKIEENSLDYEYPAQSIKVVSRVPEYKEMQISKDYAAKVYKDRIEVGCQTITIADFQKLSKLVDSFCHN